MKDSIDTQKVQITFTNEQLRIIRRLCGSMGKTDAEVVRNIVLAWLAEKSLISNNAKRKMDLESS